MGEAGDPESCRHCGHVPARRPRGLCWRCAADPAVRVRYRPRGDGATTRHCPYTGPGPDQDTNCGLGELPAYAGPDPRLPTRLRPGSEAKQALLRERVRLGLPSYVPGDRVAANDLGGTATWAAFLGGEPDGESEG